MPAFPVSRAQIFFAELDVVDAGTCSFGDLGEQGAAAGMFDRRESGFDR